MALSELTSNSQPRKAARRKGRPSRYQSSDRWHQNGQVPRSPPDAQRLATRVRNSAIADDGHVISYLAVALRLADEPAQPDLGDAVPRLRVRVTNALVHHVVIPAEHQWKRLPRDLCRRAPDGPAGFQDFPRPHSNVVAIDHPNMFPGAAAGRAETGQRR